MMIERSGGSWESATARREPDGRIVVRTGSSPHGQGHETTFAQIVADELSVDPASVEIRWGDSRAGPAGIGTFASRSTAMGGSAVLVAARKLREKGGDEAEATFESGILFPSGAYVAAVELDPETGELRSSGSPPRRLRPHVNPLLADGQIVGGRAGPRASALLEEPAYDEERPADLSASFMDYLVPTAWRDARPSTASSRTPRPSNPLGAKGAGEGGSTQRRPRSRTPSPTRSTACQRRPSLHRGEAGEALPVKPPPFEYPAPRSLDEALALLAEHGDEAKVLAGGQSLVPLLNFRLARPAHLIDLNRVGGLDGLSARRAARCASAR